MKEPGPAGASPRAAEPPPHEPADHSRPTPIDWSTPQLTLRAVLTGMLIGGVLSTCNIYTGLTLGWGINMSIVSCLVSYAFWQAMHACFRTRPWTILENNINQAAASSGAAVSSAGLVAPIPALTMLTGQTLDWHWLALWVFSVCLVGITVAIPMRRQMVLHDKLPFPSGIATAETLREMYARGAEAVARVMVLLCAAVVSALVALATHFTWMLGWISSLPSGFKLARWAPPLLFIKGHSAQALTLGLDPSLLLIGVGGLVGFRGCVSLLLGAILAWGVIAPDLINHGYARLKVSEPLPLLPVEVEPQLLPEPNGFTKYKREAGRLEHKGVMTPLERDRLLSLSSEPRYQEAIRKLFVRSQAQRPDERYFDYTTTRSLTLHEPLRKLPGDYAIPRAYGHVLDFDPMGHQLIVVGPMSDSVRDALLAAARAVLDADQKRAAAGGWAALEHSLAETWRKLRGQPALAAEVAAFEAAVNKLHERSQASVVPGGLKVPAELAEIAEFDSASNTLRVRGVVGESTADRLIALAPQNADYSQLVREVRSGSAYSGPPKANFTDVVEWLLWPGVTLMVVSSLVSFSFSWRVMLRTFTGSKGGGAGAAQAGGDQGDVSSRTFVFALGAALLLSVALQMTLFDIAWWTAILGVLLSFVLALVATRVSGETNTTPVGAMGKITQLTFGVLQPGQAAANLMTANVTGGAASQCADLMHDLKTGYMIGAVARYQAFSQMCGAFAGALLGSLAYLVMIPHPSEQLMTGQWAAPAVATWKAVAELFMVGIQALPAGAGPAIAIAAALGVLLPIIEKLTPAKARMFVPSAAAVGLAFVIPGYNSISMFIGGLLALIAASLFPKWSARFLVVLCAGLVAGDSLTGVGVSFQRIFGSG